MEQQNILTNCPLCEGHSLHLSGDKELNFMQCINCGYVSHDKMLGDKENNEEYKKLDDLLKTWVKESNNGHQKRFWIPIQITLPFGTLYPAYVDDKKKWVFANAIPIPKEEQKDYPIPGTKNAFYDFKYETEKCDFFDNFSDAFLHMQSKMKKENEKVENKKEENTTIDIKLPKLKKVD